jgi:hypothetical protein
VSSWIHAGNADLPDSIVVDCAARINTHNKRGVGRGLGSLIRSSHAPRALVCSTPRGNDWFATEYGRGHTPAYPETVSWQKTTFHNPLVDLSNIDRARREVPTEAFRCEYLAEFVDSDPEVAET